MSCHGHRHGFIIHYNWNSVICEGILNLKGSCSQPEARFLYRPFTANRRLTFRLIAGGHRCDAAEERASLVASIEVLAPQKILEAIIEDESSRDRRRSLVGVRKTPGVCHI